MKTAIIGFPRIGENRELKFATEKYFRNELTIDELEDFSKELRKKHWQLIKNSGVEGIPSNDFSFYDTTLDTACLLNVIPKELTELSLSESEKYFALARGYQGEKGDIKARPMKKWFNTNYHYIVPKFEKDTTISVTGDKIFKEYQEAKNLGIDTRPVIVGPFTLLQLSEFAPEVDRGNIVAELTTAYKEIIQRLSDLGAEWLQIDEPSLVKDVTAAELQEFQAIYQELLADAKIKVLLQTYFGDIRDAYETVIKLPFAGIGLDFIEGRKTVELLKQGFPQDKVLFAGVVNGKNIWRNNYQQTVDVLTQINQENLVLTTSCSLLHVPFTTENEDFSNEIKQHFAFAKEKLTELVDLADILAGAEEALKTNQKLFADNRFIENKVVQEKIKALAAEDYVRKPDFEERKELQKDAFDFPILPTTTIGSFPQTREVKLTRAKYKRHEISEEVYDQFIAQQINEWLKWQEEIGLDVLVHGEFERNDMVEYFGQNLSGYLFSKNGWVQSYGTRGVKPPIIWGDVAREKPITVKWSSYAQNQTEKIVKGMLTGPVTILNWSFPREDISLKDSTLQIALAIQEEVLDLEKNGVRVIQIDEAALREKLPLRKTDWYSEYLDWSIPAFRLVHSKVQATTQIHTHMCYSEFTDIIPAIDQMDADVISFEASRSNLAILDELKRQHFKTAVGPGVYDIHSPRIPAVDEIKQTIGKILAKVPLEKVWINPDCGLKTRGIPETTASLTNMTEAVKQIREEL
ncbi:5-methyltetrahydropteroyltriglutamate--homocysteine S-methyltransferase [Enterococcus dongliensis]|uniref:5-methyltetrahydropteroyltriglutamate--homocysteine methyltransferase n=1 Tax=Enterococcus dongliensis TaxID=2559925 RepID=A0AAW8TP99_9ENTE|nr:5-methyltetrahydropteroyltriglutamate--homocysteine S-methyltransferase [Enterococcus dongliensis]MDT2597152.1 5-methyltetrahydropteroyltriglutamate--homocysteine S-methyltransferase [Enterococcus dongliensis]MDT2638105.1 5-methyltetrahydropteroyltriglutamate--homocysteine S-methyltransferase [Enterococcus dongliensis]MDT2642957.1 5-methyltetrahydropteroyltriglutamate--homocysteine S-methyltransferase [Enterococcus dongliensis]MDT2648265.1 5-methyltetrahydropteroyltriglutamate--homocysteine 